MHLSRNCPFSNKTNLHLEPPGLSIALFSARKKSKNINLSYLGPETAGWGRGLPRDGVVVEKFVPPSKVCRREFKGQQNRGNRIESV